MTVLYHKRERCSWLHACRPYLDEQGSRVRDPYGHFVILRRNHTINRLSRLPSLTLLFTGFRAVPAPVTGDERPFQNFSAGTLLADRLGQCAIGDSPLRGGRHFRHSPYFVSTGTVHVVTMPAIAGTGFEPVASRL